MSGATAPRPPSSAPPGGPPAQLLPSRWEWSGFFILALLAWLVYAPALHGGFVFDDLRLIPQNPAIKLTSLTPGAWARVFATTRPVAMASFALNYYLHQEQVWGYHLVNLAIHLASGVVLYYFLKITLSLPAARLPQPSSHLAGVTAALWLLHPVQTQSVSYIVQRMNGLATFFSLLALLLYLLGRRHRQRCGKIIYFLATLAAAGLALGSKETAATLPGFVLLYEFYFFQDLRFRHWRRAGLALLILLTLLAGVVIFFPQLLPLGIIKNGYRSYPFTMGQRLLTELRVVVYYLGVLLWPAPSRLRLDYDFPLSTSLFHPFTTLPALLTLIALTAFALGGARRHRLLSFSLLWFLGNLALESSFIPLDLIFEHRLYLPSTLAILAGVLLGRRLLANHPRLWLAVAATLLLLASWTYQRNRVWGDPLTLMIDSAEKSPANGRPAYNVACVYAQGNDPGQAVHWLEKAVTASSFRYWQHLARDPDLDPIRESEVFKDFYRKYQPITTR